MDDKNMPSDEVIAKVVEMGFLYPDALEAVNAVGPIVDDVVEFILDDSRRRSHGASTSSKCLAGNWKVSRKRDLPSSHSSIQLRQSSLLDHYQTFERNEDMKTNIGFEAPVLNLKSGLNNRDEQKVKGTFPTIDLNVKKQSDSYIIDSSTDMDKKSDWEQKLSYVLQKHFGFSSLKGFQREALDAWLSQKDCLVLAATGSGKSLCFQIPALLTGNVVVVISPLISLMHDQCLKLARHGVTACFLGSGQPDSSVEQKAMRGMYSIVYVCPETVLRLIKPLQKLAETRGIALFAIDEAHCVSKWGHDFRPDYWRLSVLRRSFSQSNLKFLKFDVPLMALTATATIHVQEDILNSLCMSKETKLVLTSFFRPNLRFSVKHSRTSPRSYEKDFRELIETYAGKEGKLLIKKGTGDDTCSSLHICNIFEGSMTSHGGQKDTTASFMGDDGDVSSNEGDDLTTVKAKQMSVEYLENDTDAFKSVDDWDVAFGEFFPQSPGNDLVGSGSSDVIGPRNKLADKIRFPKEPLEEGPTIIYVPTRKETLRISKYLCNIGVKAAAYNASLPRLHLRQVHKDFHENDLQVVVATIAFGMGIDKSNVRRIIHYGWPQSLEAYYQEAGRAGRDGRLADCILYADLTRTPSLLPSQRNEDQRKQAYRMLADCFRYGMSTSCCRAKMLVEYFGEDFSHEKCRLCDVCVNGPPALQNLKEEVAIFIQAIASKYDCNSSQNWSYVDDKSYNIKPKRILEKPSLKMLVSGIREKHESLMATDMMWWRGLVRILESKGCLREGDDTVKYPEPTEMGLEFLKPTSQQTFFVHPEADMLLAHKTCKSFSSFSDWGRGWADPEIRRQRLERIEKKRKPWMPPRFNKPRKRKTQKPDLRTVRGRLTAKLLK